MFIRGSWQAARKLNCVSPGSTIFMFELITKVNGAVNSFIWGIPAMICIIGVGLYLSIMTGFIQIRRFVYAIKQTLGKIFEKKEAEKGAMTPFQAVCTALAGTVGTGNIAGVAGAIAIGGPGAVFWMWISALLGMCTKFSEVVLGMRKATGSAALCISSKTVCQKNGISWRFFSRPLVWSPCSEPATRPRSIQS